MPETLTKEEFKALKQIGDARAEGTIPTKTRNRLIEIGYAKEATLKRSLAALSSRKRACCE
jgi:hypothetical protein